MWVYQIEYWDDVVVEWIRYGHKVYSSLEKAQKVAEELTDKDGEPMTIYIVTLEIVE